MAVLCVMLFGSLCIVSWIQQSALAAQRASVIRQTVWLAETRDVSHNRVTRDDPTKLTLTSEQELAALMSVSRFTLLELTIVHHWDGCEFATPT